MTALPHAIVAVFAPPPDAGAESVSSEELAARVAELVHRPGSGLGARLDGELEQLFSISPAGLLFTYALVLGLAWAIAVLGPVAVRTAWRLGFDPRRRLGIAASVARILGLLIAIFGILRPLFSRAPTISTMLLLGLVALAAVAAPVPLRNLGAGLSMMMRSRLREGDLVEIGELEGTVRDVGLLRISLRTAEGGVTHVPASDFDRLPVTVGSRRAAMPVEARAIVDPSLGEAVLSRLRRELWFSPFRRSGTDLHLRYDPISGKIEVRMDTWASQAPAEVEHHLRALLARSLRAAEAAVEAKAQAEDEADGEEASS